MTLLRNGGVLLAAVLLSLVLFPISLLFTSYRAFRLGSLSKLTGYLAKFLLSVALSIDLLGNVVCRDLFNHVLIKPGAHPFGDNRETISSVLGKNQARNQLTDLGRGLANVLDWIQPGHVEAAAGERLD